MATDLKQNVLNIIDPTESRTLSSEEQSQLAVVSLLSWISGVFIFIFGFMIDVSHELLMSQMFYSSIFFMAPFLFRITKSLQITSNAIIANGIAAIVTTSYFTGGINSPVLVWTPLIPVLVGLLGRRKIVLISAGVSFLWVAIFFAGHHLNWNIPKVSLATNEQLIMKFRALLLMTILSTMATVFFLNRVRDKIDSLLNERDRFNKLLITVVHDIATPLTLVLNRTELAIELSKEDSDNTMTRKNLDSILDASRNIKDILEQVKTLKAIEAGKLALKKEATSLYEIIEELTNLFSERLEAKNIRLKYVNQENIEDVLYVDKKIIINHILANLVSNAIKFSFRNSTIEIGVRQHKSNRLQIFVKDQGQGMSLEQANKFNSKGKLSSTLGTEGESGTGFGLELVSYFVGAYDGQVKVVNIEDYENQGTTFSMDLPKAS